MNSRLTQPDRLVETQMVRMRWTAASCAYYRKPSMRGHDQPILFLEKGDEHPPYIWTSYLNLYFGDSYWDARNSFSGIPMTTESDKARVAILKDRPAFDHHTFQNAKVSFKRSVTLDESDYKYLIDLAEEGLESQARIEALEALLREAPTMTVKPIPKHEGYWNSWLNRIEALLGKEE